MRSLAQALLKRERIETTWAKAKETQRVAERLITLGKNGSIHARRRAQSILNDTDGVRKLFAEIAPRFQNRAGGYTRVLHLGHRAGDSAEMAWIELVELGDRLKAKPKSKAAREEKERPVAKGKPATAVKENPLPEKEKPPVAKEEPEKKPAKPEEKKPRSFVDGLRKFFKGRDNP